MPITTAIRLQRRNEALKDAVYQHRAFSAPGLSERLFTLLFSGLVYPQIWEDPEVDMQAMALAEGHRIVTIASGGCNVLAYLTRSPASVDAVDLNRAHIALNRLKLAAVRHLPGHADLFRFFGEAGNSHNAEAYRRFLAPRLDAASRAYWEGRDWRGRRRIEVFARDFYRTGLLGWFIAAGHAAARIHGADPRRVAAATTLAEQQRIFEDEIAPLFDKPLLRAALSWKASLFGLGIPPAQYDALVGDADTMAAVLKTRLRKLACDFPVSENYFAMQAFARRYPGHGAGALPHYLDAAHFDVIRANAERVRIHHVNIAELLARRPAASVDRYVLLDAQDWMTDAQINGLWAEITRTAAPGARVIFRTAAMPTLLPGRLSPAVLAQWDYREAESAAGTVRDRSAIYGGFHVYERSLS
jgi:S-adenosylmethionine-diacylglycerol 3-amino-3-carboxypropyl transferase